MDPYVGQKLVADKHRTLLAEADGERLARLASIRNRPIWKAAQRAFAAGAHRLSPVMTYARRLRSTDAAED